MSIILFRVTGCTKSSFHAPWIIGKVTGQVTKEPSEPTGRPGDSQPTGRPALERRFVSTDRLERPMLRAGRLPAGRLVPRPTSAA